MTVSIIITNYNYNHFLQDAIDSCLKQTVKPLEVILVDDCSDVVPSVPKGVKLIVHDINKGTSAARNTGIRAAKGTYILCLDADDILHPEFIEKTIGINDITSSNIEYFYNENRERKFKEFPILDDFIKCNQIVSTSLFKRDIWETINGYREDLTGLEDWDFWIRAVREGYKVQVIQEVLSYYRIHSDQSRNFQAIRDYDTLYSAIFVLFKHRQGLQRCY